MNAYRSIVLLVFLCLMGTAHGTNDVVFVGSPGWNISNGKCTFLVPGKILNQSPAGSQSGTLHLCLWVTPTPFPSTGYRVATYTLGQLKGGYQYSNLNPVTSVSIPKLTGNYYFTVSLEQYNGSTYVLSDSATPSLKTLKNGIFVNPPPWKAPKGAVIAPKKSLVVGENLNITLQGSASGGSITYVPNGSQLKLRIKIEANGRTTAYGGTKPEGAPALYTYAVKSDSYSGKKSSVGSLLLDYGHFYGVVSTSKLSLFFQQNDKGFYKSAENEQGATGTSWGIFTIK